METESTKQGYIFDNAWEQARARLQLLEATLDPGTIRFLEQLGVQPGWRCLEVGAGAGSIARSLANRVGASGHVVAIDIETRLLQSEEIQNLEVRQSDIVATPHERGGSVGARAFHLTFEQGQDALVATGAITDDEMRIVLRLFQSPSFIFVLPLVIAAWGKQPAH